MAILTKEQRNQLSKVVLEARSVAEAAARKALHSLGVDEADARGYLSEEQRALRRALRAQARQLGDKEDLRKKGTYDLYHLTEKIAYDQWHRMLFARFLAENNLLIAPDHGVPVSLQECRELAPEMGLKDEWDVAVQFAAKSLPQIFRPDDPAGRIEFAPEDHALLRNLVVGLPRDTFLAGDSLGWCYQFWQAEQKDQVNAAGNKIGADELPAVTQLFTEDYMVDFLLDNTLGAWWAGRKLTAEDAKKAEFEAEEDLRRFCSLPGVPWNYLRFIKGEDGKWTPATGTFDGWPKVAKELKCLDPCMGSGHFVVAMFQRLVALRMAEEKVEEKEAVAAVISDNLFGLEIDARCTQIAAFNLALAAWRRVGHCALPAMNLACSGLAPNTREADWLEMAGNNQNLQRGMERLYRLFQKAATLGSLINPRAGEADLLIAAFHELQPLLDQALAREAKDDAAHEMAVTAQGLAKAAEILAGPVTLVATNVPYLTEKRQGDTLKQHIQRLFRDSKADLATAFLSRCIELADHGTVAVVSPMLWLFLQSYSDLRKRLLTKTQFSAVIRLGPNAFETSKNEVVNISLAVLNPVLPSPKGRFASIDVSLEMSPSVKASALRDGSFIMLEQFGMQKNPDARITTDMPRSESQLGKYAICMRGIVTGDADKLSRTFWELAAVLNGWRLFQSTPPGTRMGRTDEKRSQLPAFTGRENIIDWSNEGRDMLRPGTTNAAYGKPGVAVGQMGSLPVTIYSGELYDNNTAPIVPHSLENLPAIWAYCTDRAFFDEVRRIDRKMNVTSATFTKIPFNLAHWQKVAAEKFPHGLPKPLSSDPTQWLFNGQPKGSDRPLQVAVARLLGYRWPRQTGSSFADCPTLGTDGLEKLADEDGIVCINTIKGEQPAAERLRALLAGAFGADWTPGKQNELLEQVGFGGKTLEDWLRNGFFEQHCQLFHQRPFIWHIWDGRRDGFSALVNYHKLNRSNLEKLTYTFLGDWIARQKAANDAGEEGSDARLQAAQELKTKLEKIIEGEDPFDIFVRWKPLEKQPIGWEPDSNDGVRLNIRPFVEAGVLRKDPKINWKKDRGKDVASAPWYRVFKGERINDHHLTLAEKRKARRLQN
jgi:hypothetical protein